MDLEIFIENLIENNNFFGSWILQGPKGVGKKTFAQKICGRLFKNDFNFSLKQHPDIYWLTKSLTDEEKKDIQKNILAGKEVDTTKDRATKKEIGVDEVRAALKFLSLKSNASRILIISLADEMNKEAQNALLKSLEEPPKNMIILLLVENKGHLLPTILSRCRQMNMPLKTKDEIQNILEKELKITLNTDMIAALAGGSIGRAIEINENGGIELYQKLIGFLRKDIPLDFEEVWSFISDLSKNIASLDLFFYFAIEIVVDLAKKYVGQEKYDELYSWLIQVKKDRVRLNLDTKHVLEMVIFKLRENYDR